MRLVRNIGGFRYRLGSLATDIYVATLVLRDPRTPRSAKVAAILFGFYILNPLDVIPDPIPILGILDDGVALWLTLFLVSQLAPGPVLEAAERHAERTDAPQRVLRILTVILGLLAIIWLAACVGFFVVVLQAVL
ncbi:MAG: YkvA family protein [Chloroflexota bacterium]